MLDSIREIFDILDFEFEAVGFDFIKYKNFEDLITALNDDKCPVVDVLKKYLYSSEDNGSHALVATGITIKNGVKHIQLKNSFADDPSEKGKVHYFREIQFRNRTQV